MSENGARRYRVEISGVQHSQIARRCMPDLLAAPQDIPILAPLIQREILYRLLVGEQGARLRQIASAGSQSHQIVQAIAWLKRHYTLPLRIEASPLHHALLTGGAPAG